MLRNIFSRNYSWWQPRKFSGSDYSLKLSDISCRYHPIRIDLMTNAPKPVHPEQYTRIPGRRTQGNASPFDPDWLLQRLLFRDIKRALIFYARGLVLDVGCGGRPYEVWVPSGARYCGVDTPGSLSSKPDAWALADSLPFTNGSFDTVICTQVLEHLTDPASALEEIARILKIGGRLILTAPQTWFLHEEPFDFYRFTRFGLEYLCKRAGLMPIELGSEGGFWSIMGISIAVHLGSYARWLGEHKKKQYKPSGSPPKWRQIIWPFRLPLALLNLLFAMLDAIPHPGLFAVNHMVIAEKR